MRTFFFFITACLRGSRGHLGKVLQGRVDSVPDGLVEGALHPAHEHLQAFDHGVTWPGTDQSELTGLSTPTSTGTLGMSQGGCWRKDFQKHEASQQC